MDVIVRRANLPVSKYFSARLFGMKVWIKMNGITIERSVRQHTTSWATWHRCCDQADIVFPPCPLLWAAGVKVLMMMYLFNKVLNLCKMIFKMIFHDNCLLQSHCIKILWLSFSLPYSFFFVRMDGTLFTTFNNGEKALEKVSPSTVAGAKAFSVIYADITIILHKSVVSVVVWVE